MCFLPSPRGLMTSRPRNRRIAEEMFDAADLAQPANEDLKEKVAALDRVKSVESDRL
jgi:hypothetical protein